MANLRIVYDNAADRSTISTNSTAGTLNAQNMLTDIKSEIWRSSASTSVLITLSWSTAEILSMVAFPFASLTETATIRVRGYLEVGDSVPAYDTGTQLAAPSAFGSVAWGTLPLGVNAYSYGGGNYAAIWFPTMSVKKILVTLTDNANPNGYIEAARCVCGSYWEPQINCEYGVEIGAGDMSKHERSDAGDLRTDRGPRYKILNVDLSLMPNTDRNQMWRILLGNGMSRPIYFSLLPDSSDDPQGEQIYQVYGKLTKGSSIKFQFLNQFNTSLELEEI